MLREHQLLTCVPDVLNYNSLLYIGAGESRQQTLNLFIYKGYDYTILEVWKPNSDWLKKHFKNVFEGDVRDVDKFGFTPFDIVMWWHGPEHLKENDVVLVLRKLRLLTKKILITACPWGIYESGPFGGNPYARHLSYLYPDFFNKLGFHTNAIGTKDVKGGNLLAWQIQ